MEFSLNKLILELEKLNKDQLVKESNDCLELFNKKNENNFSFIDLQINIDEKKKFGQIITGYFEKSIINFESNKNETSLTLLMNCLDTVRLISRDSNAIDSFDNDSLLSLIQQLARLDMNKSLENETLTLKALKSISNLIYNGKFAQNYYSNESMCLKLVDFVKNFQLNTNKNSENDLFKLKILFLLTIFNKKLRETLRDESHLISYLIKLIDIIPLNRMKLNKTLNYCFLTQTDVLFLIEALKILYNLTMDIDSVRKDAASIFNTSNLSDLDKKSQQQDANDQYYFSNLVCILRDLLVCKLEDDNNDDDDDKKQGLMLNASKLNDLHSNIINLLTNVPAVYFNQLVYSNETKLSDLDKLESEFEIARHYHNMKRMFRLANLNKKKNENNLEYELVNLVKSDQDINYKGNNMEAIAYILSFMSQHTCSYLIKNKSLNSKDFKFSNMSIDSIDHLYPVLMLLSLMCKKNKRIHSFVHLKVLPPLIKQDLMNLPQNGLSIRNRLCRLMTDPNLQLKRLSAQFVFILCKESVNKLVKYTGFGNAAGLLAEAGLMLSGHGDLGAYSSDSNDSETEDYKKYEKEINPITGRIEIDESSESNDETDSKNNESKSCLIKSSMFKKAKKRDIFKGMTEEQKEYEAMKLVEAFDRLTKIGAVKPATIGNDGKPIEISHVLQLQETIKQDSDEEKS